MIWRALIVSVFMMACSPKAQPKLTDESVQVRIPAGFPPIDYPLGNEPTKLRIELGRRLFYDNRLSANQELNCGSCHVLSAAFTDGRMVSPGIHGISGMRNSPTLVNLAWMKRFMMEGGVPSLETQALAPLHDSLEMGSNMMLAVARLNLDPLMRELSRAAYNRDTLDAYVVTRALGCFQRTLISGDGRYDRYLQGQKNIVNENELRGRELFFSERTQCASCHSGVFYTDMDYHNIGLQEDYADVGKARATHRDEDMGRFKTPTLRNIQLTGPYMHDGSVSSLEEVVGFYNSGGRVHRNKDARMHPLDLTPQEQSDLVAFMTTLTDWNFVQNKDLLPLVQ